MFTYNQDSAMKAGGVIREGGAYAGVIKSAIFDQSQKGTKYLELTFESSEGAEFKFLTLYFQKADGTEVKGGASMINAIMGLTQVQQLTPVQIPVANVTEAKELAGKPIGLLLQKVLYTKNDGTDGYKFEIRLPFHFKTRQTLKEMVNKSQPEMVDRMAATLTDKDERNTNQNNQSFSQPQPQGFGSAPQNGSNAPSNGFGTPQSPSDFGVPEVPSDTFDPFNP